MPQSRCLTLWTGTQIAPGMREERRNRDDKRVHLTAGHRGGDLTGHVFPIVVIPAENPDIGMTRETGNGPHVSAGHVQAAGNSSMPKTMGPERETDRAADPVYDLV